MTNIMRYLSIKHMQSEIILKNVFIVLRFLPTPLLTIDNTAASC